MQRTFTLKGRRYRVNLKKAASALIGLAGFGLWIYVIAFLGRAVLLG